MVVQLGPGILLYQGSIDLENSVNANSSIANKTKQTASSLLEGARGKLSSRDFSGAATQFSKAAAALASNAGYASTAQQLANRANSIATH
jgi:hypothetical protein